MSLSRERLTQCAGCGDDLLVASVYRHDDHPDALFCSPACAICYDGLVTSPLLGLPMSPDVARETIRRHKHAGHMPAAPPMTALDAAEIAKRSGPAWG